MNDPLPPPNEALASEKLVIGRKTFLLELKENPHGCFLKISEEIHRRRDTIMLPREGFELFAEALSRLIAKEGKLK